MERAKNMFARAGKPKASSSNTAARPGSSNTPATSSKKTMESLEAPLKLWVPNVFQEGESVFFMSASHRGDMYHLRAALQIENFSVILHDSDHSDPKKSTEDLEDYLAKSVLKKGKHIFVCPWRYDILHGDTPPDDMTGCLLDGKKYDKQAHKLTKPKLLTYSENIATKFIENAPKQRQQDIANGMTILDMPMADNKFPDYNALSGKYREVSKEFEKLWKDWKKDGVKAGENAILLMHRATGTQGMGVHPELDNGDANEEIERIVSEISSEKNKPLTIFTCGLDVSATRLLPTGELHGIGKYWLKIDDLNPNKKEISKRDFEAYFLKWSHRNKHFMMVTGFRSGALDLCTFMGIPTVSIGLRNMSGEPRHRRLADERFQRVNIQYDQPRHKVTAAVLSKRGSNAPMENQAASEDSQTMFGSPFWREDYYAPPGANPKRDIPRDTIEAQKQSPRTFYPFDRVVVKTGYIIALQKYFKWEQTILSLKKTLPCVVTTSTARFCYPFKAFGNQTAITKHFNENEKLDQEDVNQVKTNLEQSSETLQLSKSMFGKYVDGYNNDWKDVENLIGGPAKILGRGITWKRKLPVKID